MKRRTFIAGLGSAVAWPVVVGAQEGRVRHIGVLIAYPKGDPFAQSSLEAFIRALQTLGWSEGRNVRIDYRDLVARRPDVIFAFHGAPVVKALAQETQTIPIVFTGVSDPTSLGFADGLAQPGRNVTGFSLYEPSFATKWLEALKRIAPNVRRVAVIHNPTTSTPTLYLPSLEAAAASLAVELVKAEVGNVADIESAIAAVAPQNEGGLIVLPDYNSDWTSSVGGTLTR